MAASSACGQLADAIEGLEQPYRSAIVLRYFDGLAPRSIAASTGVPVRTVQTRLHRGLQMLRARLDRAHGDRERWLTALAPLAFPASKTAAFALLTMSTQAKLIAAGIAGSLLLGIGFAWPADEPADTTITAEPELPGRVSSVLVAPSQARREKRDDTTKLATLPTVKPAPEPFVVAGMILDLEARPVPGARIRFLRFGDSRAQAPVTMSNDRGVFRFEVPAVAGGNVEVDDAGWVTVYRPVLWGNRDIGELTVVVAPSITVRGTVVDPSGAPIAAADIRVSAKLPPRARFGRSLERNMAAEWTATSDAAGAFSLRAPRLDDTSLHTRHPGYESDRRALPEGGAPPQRIVLAERRGRLLRGIVERRDGSPVNNAAVFCNDVIVTTDDAGRFEVDLGKVHQDSVRKRHRWLVAASRGSLPARLRCRNEAWRDPAMWPHPLVLRLGGPTTVLSGRVVDAEGHPLKNATVTLLDGEPIGDAAPHAPPAGQMATFEWISKVDVETGANDVVFSEEGERLAPGHFVVAGLQPGRHYRLRVTLQSQLREIVTEPLLAGDGNVVVRFPRAALHARIAGLVVDRRDRPVRAAGVWIRRTVDKKTRETGRSETDRDGKFSCSGIARSAEWLVVQAPGIARATSFRLSRLGNLGRLRVVVPVCAKVRVAPSALTLQADRIAFLDRGGSPVYVTFTQGNVAWGRKQVPILSGKTEVFAVPDNAVLAVLSYKGKELSRFAVDLAPGKVWVLRP